MYFYIAREGFHFIQYDILVRERLNKIITLTDILTINVPDISYARNS